MASEVTPRSASHVILAYDATKDRSVYELKITLERIRLRGDLLQCGDKVVVLGILHKVTHPMGYQSIPCSDAFDTSFRAVEEEVSMKVDSYVRMLQQSAEECEDEGVSVEVKITAGTPMKTVILQEVLANKAAWVVLDRHLRRDLKFYLKQMPCKVALVQDSLSVDVLKHNMTNEIDATEYKLFYSMSQSVPVVNHQGGENTKLREFGYPSPNTGSSAKKEKSGIHSKADNNIFSPSKIIQNLQKGVVRQRHRSSGGPILCSVCGLRTELYVKDSMIFSFLEIQQATKDFTRENLLGEGGYGHVYKGVLKDGQLIAAKVRKEESMQGFTEFRSEIYILNFARHKNIMMLLGYCCKENLNILVYEYICNKSLDWHLFDRAANVLDWHQRHAIAIGIAKGLHFLHEGCRGCPIIHRDVRPNNILLTHDFVPMLGDFGLARWKTEDDTLHTRILGALGYLAPEYVENGIVSVRTDVYAFGIVLLQLISGRKAIDLARNEEQQSTRSWAEAQIEKHAIHELIDPRIAETYDAGELHLMVKTAHLCVQRSPEKRPSMGDILRLLEGEKSCLKLK